MMQPWDFPLQAVGVFCVSWLKFKVAPWTWLKPCLWYFFRFPNSLDEGKSKVSADGPTWDTVPLISSQFSGSGLISKATYSTILTCGLGFTSTSSQTGDGSMKAAKQFPILRGL